jgi:hypothetical protein
VKPTEAPRPAGDALGDGAFGDLWPLVSAIEGWLSREQACALYKAAGAVEAGNWIVEIGAHHGRSTVALAKGMSSAAGLLSVDPYPDRPGGGGEPAFEAYLDNVRRLGLTHRVHLFRGTSEQAASCCELLFEVAGAEQGEPIPAGPVDRPGIGSCSWTVSTTVTPSWRTSISGNPASSTEDWRVSMTRSSGSASRWR